MYISHRGAKFSFPCKIQFLILKTSQFQAKSENSKHLNLNYKQDLRILDTRSKLRARLNTDKRPKFSFQREKNLTLEHKSTLIFRLILI